MTDSHLTKEELETVKQVFTAFKKDDGTVDPHELVEYLEMFNFNNSSPIIFELLQSYDTPENVKNGLTYEAFVDSINEKLDDKEGKESLQRYFDLFVEDPNQETIDFKCLKRVYEELGQNVKDEDIKNLLQNATSDGKDIDFDTFCDIMTKKALP